MPIYHNLYYAGKWRFFVDVSDLPFLTHSARAATGINYAFIINNLIHYLGLEIESGKVTFLFIGILFLPFATFLYFFLLQKLPKATEKLFFYS